MNDAPTPLTCDRCGAEFESGSAVAYLGERVMHARPDECVAAFRRLIAALEEENAALRKQVAELKQELDGHVALWDSHFPASNETWLASSTTVASTSPGAMFGASGLWDNLNRFYPTSLACMECGRAAEVEVPGEGHLRPLCWECSGCKANYWLPDHHRCFLCGKEASGQATYGDGLTRPVCPWCAGVDGGEEE